MMAEQPSLAEMWGIDFPIGIPVDKRRYMILTAYFDESGTHRNSEAVSVAGYISTPARWLAFDAQWREALADFGLDFFHMTDFAVKAPPYDDWPEAQRRERISRLIAIINRNVEFSVGNVIPVATFNDTLPAAARDYCGGAYGLGVISAFLTVGEFVRRHYPDQWVAYVFETGAPGAGQIQKLFADNEQRPEQKHHLRLFRLGFENKRASTPIQAADILAYELYKHWPRQMGVSPRPIRKKLLDLLSGAPHDWGHLDRQQLSQWAEIIRLRLALNQAQQRLDGKSRVN